MKNTRVVMGTLVTLDYKKIGSNVGLKDMIRLCQKYEHDNSGFDARANIVSREPLLYDVYGSLHSLFYYWEQQTRKRKRRVSNGR